MQIREDLLPQPGAVIASQYEVSSLLGHGGMGAVFAGKHLRTGRAVAIKWMLPQAAKSTDAVQRFIAEAQATARIEHPNVVHIYDFGADDGAPYLVMERLRGESLRERLDREGRLGAVAAVRLMLPAMKGVAEAHREGIIHRDLKPDNIFLCQGKDGSEREAKVVDFGISKLYDSDGPSNLTGTGMMMGTPSYMSPEQLNAPKEADVRFDVYALGIVLYEAVTGRCPYEAEGIFQLVGQIMSGQLTPPRSLAPECTPELESVILKAMHRDANQRYATVQDLMDALRAVQRTLGPVGPDAPVASAADLSHAGAAHANTPFPPTAMSPTPAPQPTAVLQPGMTPPGPYPHTGPLPPPGHGTHAGYGSHAGFAGQPGSYPGASVPGPIGTPYAPYPPPKRSGGGAGKWIALAMVALFLGATSAAAGWFFLLGPGRDAVAGVEEDDAPVTPVPPPTATPAPEVAAIAAPPPAPAPATVVAPPPPSVDAPPTEAPVAGATEEETEDVAPDEEETEEPSRPTRPRWATGRRRPTPPPPTPRPIVRPVSPPVVTRPPPRRGGTGTNGAMIIE